MSTSYTTGAPKRWRQACKYRVWATLSHFVRLADSSPCSDSACRALILAFVTAWTFPLINSIGVTATNTLFAIVAWLGYGCVCNTSCGVFTLSSMLFRMILFTIRYGDRMRAWVDIGYTTSRDTC